MRNAPEKYNSLGYFNLARGLGMLLILAGHSVVPFIGVSIGEPGLFSGAGSVIGGGVMAMFFMLSGFSFYSRSTKKCLSMQTKLLLKPYYMVVLALIAARTLLTLVRGRPILDLFKEILLTYMLGLNAENSSALIGEPIKSITILWFILALFVGWIVFNSICRVKDKRLRQVLIAACIVLSWVLTLISKAWPFCLPMGMLAAGYLAAGYFIKQRNLLTAKLPAWVWCLMVCVTLLSCAFGMVDIGAGIWQLGLLDVAATFCIGFILLRAYAWFMELELHAPAIQLLERIGNRSIWIVFLHAFEKTIFPWYRLNSLFPHSPWLNTIICFVCRSAMIWVMYRMLTWINRNTRKKRKRKITIES